MIKSILIHSESKIIVEDSIEFLQHTTPSKALVVIFPGGKNSTKIPPLHYAKKAAISLGCDVLSMKYVGELNFEDTDNYRSIVKECFNIINKIDIKSYERVCFISKSIGNLVALDVESEYFDTEVIHVFYTPLDSLVERVQFKECLVFTGDNDNRIKPESIELFKSYRNAEVHMFSNAQHSFEVNNDVFESLDILCKATGILVNYLKGALV